MAKQKITMTIDARVFAAFKDFCKRRAMKVSSKVELMMREFVEGEDEPKEAEKGAGKSASKSTPKSVEKSEEKGAEKELEGER